MSPLNRRRLAAFRASKRGVISLVVFRLVFFLSLFAGPLWGMVSDRIGRPRSLVTSVSVALVGTLIPVFWPVFAWSSATRPPPLSMYCNSAALIPG